MNGTAAEKNYQRFTYADYKTWELKPGERFELIDGIAYAMSAPGFIHQAISTTLIGEFFNFLKGKPCRVIAAPFDVRLFYEEDEGDDTVVQPDLVVVCDPKKLGEEDCRSAPDLAVEILSPSNSAIEMERKFNVYREAGVREYWVVDPKNKCITLHILQSGEYTMQKIRGSGVVHSSVLSGLEIALSELFSEIMGE